MAMNSKKILWLIRIVWIAIGIFLIFLPSFVGPEFDIQENKKYVYLYVIFSAVVMPVIKNKVKKYNQN
jgi:cell division protein FtsW (lipid II flippase)